MWQVYGPHACVPASSPPPLPEAPLLELLDPLPLPPEVPPDPEIPLLPPEPLPAPELVLDPTPPDDPEPLADPEPPLDPDELSALLSAAASLEPDGPLVAEQLTAHSAMHETMLGVTDRALKDFMGPPA